MSNRLGASEQGCGGDAAAYVLGALEPAQAHAFEAHLASCAICRDEVDALVGVVQALPTATPQYPASKRLRRQVMRSVRHEARSARRRQKRAAAFRRPVNPRMALAGTVAALAAAGTIGAIEATTSTRSSRVVQARVIGPGRAELVLSDGRVDLIAYHLSPPPPGQIYEVWLQAAHRQPTPAGVLFSPTSSNRTDVALPESLHGIDRLMVTSEPQSGSLVPTHAPVIVAQLT